MQITNSLNAELDRIVKAYDEPLIISGDIEFEQSKVVSQITHYLLSRYTGPLGQKDELGRRKPFRNVVNAIVDIEKRATDIDRKNIQILSQDGDYVFSLVVRKELEHWMEESDFGKTINELQGAKIEYGSVLAKKTETEDELMIEAADWEHIVVDANDIEDGAKIEKHFLSPIQLQQKKSVWDEDAIDALINENEKTRKDGTNNHRAEVWDIEGIFLESEINEDVEEDDADYKLYNLIIGVASGKKFMLDHNELDESRYKQHNRKTVPGRSLGLGAVEESFEAQIWTNDAVIGERDAMDFAGKVIIKTNKRDLGSSGFTQLRNGKVVILEDGEYMESQQFVPSALGEFQVQIDNWFTNLQRQTSTFNAISGEIQKAGTPFSGQALQSAQASSIFDYRREQDGFFFVDVIDDWVMPHIAQDASKEHTLSAEYTPEEIRMIDESKVADAVNEYIDDQFIAGEEIDPDRVEQIRLETQSELAKQGKRRTITVPAGYITLEKIRAKTSTHITNEQDDAQTRINSLLATMQGLSPEDPARGAIVQQVMELSGISPATYPVLSGGTPGNAAQVSSVANNIDAVTPDALTV